MSRSEADKAYWVGATDEKREGAWVWERSGRNISDDYFLSMCLTSINCMLMIMMTLTRYLLGDLESLIFFRAMTGFAANRTILHEASFIW